MAEAQLAFNQAVKLDPDNREAREYLANIAESSQNEDACSGDQETKADQTLEEQPRTVPGEMFTSHLPTHLREFLHAREGKNEEEEAAEERGHIMDDRLLTRHTHAQREWEARAA